MHIARSSLPAFPGSFSNLGCHGIFYWVELETEMSQLTLELAPAVNLVQMVTRLQTNVFTAYWTFGDPIFEP